MAGPKTKRTKASVAAFFNSVADETRRKEAKVVDKLYREVTGQRPAMWGTSIVGYGSYESATGEWPRIAFSPRKANLVLYGLIGGLDSAGLLAKLGPHKAGKGCLYITKLANVDEAVLRKLISRAWTRMASKHDKM